MSKPKAMHRILLLGREDMENSIRINNEQSFKGNTNCRPKKKKRK